ncbi:MAG: tRNA (adenosine(37)-N6)-dimethylallyltransferase MiaA [Planctomycetaceae bacterium]
MPFDVTLLRRCWFLAGPTASGKSAIALELAERIDAEIVALDSMTLYRRMDLGTAKPTALERQRIPHHLFDILEPWEDYTVADYLQAAEGACLDITKRGRTPLFVGGAGLYLRSLLRGVFNGPAADWELRRQLAAEAVRQPAGWLHAELHKVDPKSAARLHPADERRLLRAIEVYRVTGQPASELQAEQPLPPHDRPRHVYWIDPPRSWLYERINQRVISMMSAGLLNEVRELLADPRGLGRTASQALGYKELATHLRGEQSLDASIETIQRRTRQFAKRQHTWFRNLEECRPLHLNLCHTPADLAIEIETLARTSGAVT